MVITQPHWCGLFRRLVEFVLLSLSTSAVLFAQAIQVLPSQVIIRMTATGPLAVPQTLSIGSDVNASLSWTATASADAPWISMSATTGTTPTQVSLSLVAWRGAAQPPGSYSGTITFSAVGAKSAAVKVIWTVVPQLPNPTFSYPSGPNGCTPTSGYPDLATCTVPEEKPPGNFQPSAPGGSYADPNFGASVKVVTGSGVYHTYSANNPLSAKNKYLMTYLTNGTFNVVDVATGRFAFTRVNANENFFWDSYIDSIYYYPSGAAVIKHDLQSGMESTVIDYGKDGHGFTQVVRGSTTGSSKDNWISFFAPNEKQVCVLDLNTVKTYCADWGGGTIDYTLDSKGVDEASGKRYVIVVAGNGAFYSVNLKSGKLDLEFWGPEAPDSNGNHDGVCDPGEKCMNPSHSDTFEDSSGTQYIVFDSFTENPCEVALATYQLNKGVNILQPVELGGGRRKVMSLWQCPFPNANKGTDEHIGCAKNAPFCVISTVSPYRNPSDPPLRFPHATEIMVMRENGLEVRRLAESRSVRFWQDGFDGAYWAEPRAAISNDGSLVVSDSNFGEIAGVRVTLIATGFGKPSMAVLNAASWSPSLAPGAYASLLGSGLANCTARLDTSGPPDQLCGTRASVNGLPAKLTYASPRQINLLIPRLLSVQTDLTVSASVEGASAPFVSVVPAAQFAEVAPAIFTYALDDGISRAVVQNAAGILNGPAAPGSSATPAVLGEVQVLWANALGPTTQTVPDGEPAPGAPSLAATMRPVGVYVNGTRQAVQFSGLAPGLSGVYQVNFLLSPDTPVMDEGQNFVWIVIDGVESPQLPISVSAAK